MPTDKQDGQRVDDTAGNAALHDDVALASWAGIALWVSECRHQVLFHSPHLQARRGSPTRRNNASEQSLRGPTVAAMFWMAGCTAVSEPIRVSWTISWTSDSSRASPSKRSRARGVQLTRQVLMLGLRRTSWFACR